MGKLLRKLHLQDKLPDDLAAASKQIGKVEDKLKSAQIKELKLKSSVSDAVENLNDLANQIEQVLLAAKKKQLESLARRISGRAPDDPGLRTDAFELQMLKAQTDAALKDNKANRAALDTARTKFGEALVARVDSGGDLATDLKNYIEQQFGDDNMTRVNAALAGLDGLKKHPDPRIAGAAKAATAMVAKSALERQKEEGPSTSPRDASRTPNDVLVHLSTVVNNAMGSYGDDVELKRIAAAGRKLFMSHTLDTKKVKLLIADAKVAFERLGEDDLAGLCGTLNGHLSKPKENEDDDEEDAEPTRAQLNDNLYGRVFDTKMVSSLVKNSCWGNCWRRLGRAGRRSRRCCRTGRTTRRRRSISSTITSRRTSGRGRRRCRGSTRSRRRRTARRRWRRSSNS